MNFQDMIRESYDSSNRALKVNVVSGTITASSQVTVTLANTPTIYAVVNTAAAGEASVVIDGPVAIKGNLTLSDSKGFIGLISTTGRADIWAGGAAVNSVGFDADAAAPGSGLNAGAFGYVFNGTDWDRVRGDITNGLLVNLGTNNDVVVTGNMTLSDAKTYIGLTTSTIGNTPTVFLGTPTLYAVVNTGAAGVGNSIVTVANPNFGIIGNVTITDSKNFIGLVTTVTGNTSLVNYGQYYPAFQSVASGMLAPLAVDARGKQLIGAGADYIGLVTIDIGTNKTISVAGNLTLSDPKGFIGLTTAVNGQAWPDPKTYIGLVTVGHTVTVGSHGITGNLTISDSKGYIGLNTVTNGVGDRFMGLVTAWVSGIAGNVTISDSKGFIGLVTLGGGTAWTDPKTFIGLVTADLDHAWPDPKTYIGLTTTTLGIGTTFIGLVTAQTRNAGSAKTLTPYAITLSTSSVATIAVPTNNAAMYITNMILSSDATVRFSIKSGVTYLTGNASLGISLNPGGGFYMTGSPDSPSWIGLPSGALVVEKFDMTGTKANIGGNVITFTE